jgi:hypothetical protein
MLRVWRVITILLAALGLTLGAAHVLEMPAKMRYDPAMYAAVNSTLYLLFGTVGAAIQLSAVAAAGALAYISRGRRGFRLTLIGTLSLLLSLLLWAALVAPVNAEWAAALRSAPDSASAAYARLRPRWEYGHVAAFVAWLIGFVLIVAAVVVETPGDSTQRG